MINGKPLVWILDDEWLDHSVEKEIYEQHGFEVKVTRSDALAVDVPKYAPFADGVVAQAGFHLNARLIDQLEVCRVISASAVGYNHIDVEYALEKGIPVTHVPEYCTEEVSDHTLALMLTVVRRLPAYHRQVQAGKWDPLDSLSIHRFNQHTVGLLGLGKIGSRVAQKLNPFGMRMMAHDPNAPSARFAELGVESVTFEAD